MLPFKLKNKRPRRRVALIGLDGVSYDQIIDLSNNGYLPNITKLMEDGSLFRMKSSSPSISPVSWTSCITGVNPATHGMFGYMDRRRESYGIYFPNALQIVSPQIWDYVTAANKTTVAVNVPQTYPAKEINGVLISGFVSLDFKKAVFPQQICSALEQIDYRIDVDFNEHSDDRTIMYEALLYMLKKRRETCNYFMDRVDWNLFVGVISGTGRINLYQGRLLERAPDLILEGVPGYELSSDIDKDCLLGKSRYEGVPTSQDAFLCMKGLDALKSKPHIIDLFPTILNILDVPFAAKN